MATLDDLRGMYESFCSFGSSRNLANPHGSMESMNGPTMDGAKFAKFCRDNRLIDNKKVMSTDVDIIFNKVKPKGARKLDWNTFQDALALVAEKKYPGKNGDEGFQTLVNTLVRKGTGPISTGTVPQHDAVVDRMTDTTLYTGTHKLRFDEAGHGRGMEGRDQPNRTHDLSQITNREETTVRGLPASVDPQAHQGTSRLGTGSKRAHTNTASNERLDAIANKPKKSNTTSSPTGSKTNLSGSKSNSNLSGSRGNLGGSPTKKPTTSSSTKPTTAGKQYKPSGSDGSVFDRLTNTNAYTGTHKLRFNEDGSGRGIAGRDAPAKGGAPGTYRGGNVQELSQILRS